MSIRVIIAGFKGKMGQAACQMVLADPDLDLVAVLDPFESESEWQGIPVFKDKADLAGFEADVWVDFTTPTVAYENTRFALENSFAPVVGTTGFTSEEIAELKAFSRTQDLGGLIAPNFALGAVLLMQFARQAAKYFPNVEIIELHHDKKKDAPSGTALALADSINEAMDNQYHYIYDRSQRREMRDDKEIGISAVRGGTIVGEHEVIFAGPDEVIEFKHTAYSKAVFGKGAVEAAKFLAGKPAGRYDMSDVISAK